MKRRQPILPRLYIIPGQNPHWTLRQLQCQTKLRFKRNDISAPRIDDATAK